MAKFTFATLKEGYENKPLDYVTALVSIQFEPTDTHVAVPSHHEGKPVTHVCYVQDYTPAHEHWHDWHHPTAFGSEWVEGKYSLTSASTIVIPPHVKTLTLPNSVKHVGYHAFAYGKSTAVLFEEGPLYSKRLLDDVKSCK